jgi:hypothetical protein
MCGPGEAQGVVIARLEKVQTDWLASPVMEFLYGTDDPDEVLPYATHEQVVALRESFRRRYLQGVVDTGDDGAVKDDENKDWWEVVAMAYNRRMWGYQLATTREQDEELVAALNANPNVHHYALSKYNCANFAATLVNFYYPGLVKANKVADFGWMTPKQVARSVFSYGRSHPEAQLKVFEVPQVPGTQVRSRPAWGGSEFMIKTKRYLAAMLVLQPELELAIAVMYMDRGRWKLGQGCEPVEPAMFASRAPGFSGAASAGHE